MFRFKVIRAIRQPLNRNLIWTDLDWSSLNLDQRFSPTIPDHNVVSVDYQIRACRFEHLLWSLDPTLVTISSNYTRESNRLPTMIPTDKKCEWKNEGIAWQRVLSCNPVYQDVAAWYWKCWRYGWLRNTKPSRMSNDISKTRYGNCK